MKASGERPGWAKVAAKLLRAGRATTGKRPISKPSNSQPRNAAMRTIHCARVMRVLVGFGIDGVSSVGIDPSGSHAVEQLREGQDKDLLRFAMISEFRGQGFLDRINRMDRIGDANLSLIRCRGAE